MCQSNFGRKQSLQTHIRSIHGEKESFKCEICEAKFSQGHFLDISNS